MKISYYAAAVAATFAMPAAAQTVVYNANPSTPFTYGSGNDYTPANAAVLTNGNTELAARFHINKQVASPSNATGVYTFALGTSLINFDYSVVNFDPNDVASVVLTNLKTGDAAFYNFLVFPDANGALAGYQGSQQLGFGFLNGNFPPFGDLNFDPNVDNTYRFDLVVGGNTLTTFAQLGAGAPPAVPEPSAWALMILGFGMAGAAMRRRRTLAAVTFA